MMYGLLRVAYLSQSEEAMCRRRGSSVWYGGETIMRRVKLYGRGNKVVSRKW